MRAHFAADFYAARSRFTNQSHTSSCSDVLAMNVMIAKFRKQNVAHHHHFLACGGPTGQPKQSAPVAFVHDAVADQIVILTMIEHRQANHAGVLNRPAHHLVILYAMSVVCVGNNTCLRK